MIMTYEFEVGHRVRPRGVRPKERGRSWLGTVTDVQVAYPVGSDVPYRTLTVQSDLGEVWTGDQRDWLPAMGRDARVRSIGRSYVYVGGIRVGWYDVGVWAGVLFILAFMFLAFPCGLVLGGIPLVMILYSYHQDRRRENLNVAAANAARNQEGRHSGP